jgi:alkyl hydroperoxide reductase subunit AhpF
LRLFTAALMPQAPGCKLQAIHVIAHDGGAFAARPVIVASGVAARTLGVPGEQRLRGYGATYSATSHAPLFAGRRVVVGDNLRALRAAIELRAIAAHVTLVAQNPLDVDGYALSRQLLSDEQVTALLQHHVVETKPPADKTHRGFRFESPLESSIRGTRPND